MDERQVLSLVKARLNRLASDTSLDDYLAARIKGALREFVSVRGIHLQNDADDMMLLVDYVTWQYQNREAGLSAVTRPGTSGEPDWLRIRLRNRWASFKGRS